MSCLKTLCHRSGLTHKEAAEFLGITYRTFQHWLKDGAPDWAKLLLAIRAGHVPWDGWSEWEMVNNGLLAPGYRTAFIPGDILSMHYRLQQLRELKRQIREFNTLED